MAKSMPRTVATWGLSVLLGVLFIASGLPKILAMDEPLRSFQAFGLGRPLMTLTGVLEVVGGIALLIPIVASPAALLLATVMVGAIYTHVSTEVGSPLFAAVLLVALLVLAVLRRKVAR